MIHYIKHGTGNPIILIHGFPNDGTCWEHIIPELAKQYCVIVPDLPGAGHSEMSEEDLTMEYMAHSILEIMDREGIDKAVLAGHSMGGYTAMQFAALYPERVKAISLIHSLASADSDEKKEVRRKSILLMKKGQPEQRMFLKGMAQNLFAPEYAAQYPEMVQKIVDKGLEVSGDTLAAFYHAIMNRADHRGVLNKAKFPVQWIIGNYDNATSMADALDQCHIAPVNMVSIYKPCGHMSFMEKPQRLIADLMSLMEYCY